MLSYKNIDLVFIISMKLIVKLFQQICEHWKLLFFVSGLKN